MYVRMPACDVPIISYRNGKLNTVLSLMFSFLLHIMRNMYVIEFYCIFILHTCLRVYFVRYNILTIKLVRIQCAVII